MFKFKLWAHFRKWNCQVQLSLSLSLTLLYVTSSFLQQSSYIWQLWMVCKADMSLSFQSSFLGLCVGHSELATCLSVPCLCPTTAWLGSSTPEAMNAGDAVMEYISAVRLKMTEPRVSRKICCSYFTCFESKCDFKEAQKWCVDVHPKSSKLLLQACGNQTWIEVFKQLTSLLFFFWRWRGGRSGI